MSTKIQSDPQLLDTLAQLRQNEYSQGLQSEDTLTKRARAKYLTNHLVMQLVAQDSDLRTNYWNAFHCSNTLTQVGQKLTTTYCKNRWCLVCNRIQAAKAIKGYTSEIEAMTDRQFVTLTRPNVPAHELEVEIKLLHRSLKSIQDRMRRTHRKPLYGIRKFESTYNWVEDTYHPHFHLIIQGKEVAELLVEEWLRENIHASPKAQKIQPADEKSTIELFKYFTKIATPLKIGHHTEKIIDPKSLDVIFRAIRGRRVIQPIGGMRKVNIEVEELRSEIYDSLEPVDYGQWHFCTRTGDWIMEETGQVLTGYVPSERFKEWVGAHKFESIKAKIDQINTRRYA